MWCLPLNSLQDGVDVLIRLGEADPPPLDLDAVHAGDESRRQAVRPQLRRKGN